MKTIEALISLMVLLSFTSITLLSAPVYPSQLQNQQLAEDIWRIAYLKGCFNQSAPSMNPEGEMADCLNPLLEEIEAETGLRIAFYSPIQAAAGESLPNEGAATITKTILVNGVPQQVQMKAG